MNCSTIQKPSNYAAVEIRRNLDSFVVTCYAIYAVIFSTLVIVQAADGTPSRETITQNIRDGFAAQTGFRIISVESVPAHDREHSSIQTSGYAEILTYPLHHQPRAYGYKVDDTRLAHMQWITLAWKKDRRAFPFVFDLYLHGNRDALETLAILVPHLDIRKFLHQSIASLGADRKLIKLQAYFSEFARKAKIVYPAPFSQGTEEPSVSYHERLLDELREEISHVLSTPERLDTKELQPLQRALQELQHSASPRLDTVHRNIHRALAFHRSHAIQTEGMLTRRPVLELLTSLLIAINTAQHTASLKITNNCREPGNYEVEVRDALGRALLRGNFNFDYTLYSQILRHYHGLGIREQGTGFRISSNVRRLAWQRYWDSLLPWKWIKSFPQVSIDALSNLRVTGSKDIPHSPPVLGEIDVTRGSIPFQQYDTEVRNKSAFRHHGHEPLSYIRVDPSLPVPAGFEPPIAMPMRMYWTSKAHIGRVVPHHFRTFEDVQRYDVLLSEFDLNGVYSGHSALDKRDKDKKDGRWHFNYSYLQDLTGFEFRQWSTGYGELRLTSHARHADGVSFVFGNFALHVGESIKFLLGIGIQPLITAYNQNVYQEPLLYGFAYGADGTILDHHERGIGVEQVYIERTDTHTYKVRLISHERILPVWEGMMRIPLMNHVSQERSREKLNRPALTRADVSAAIHTLKTPSH